MDAVAQTILLFELERSKTTKAFASALLVKKLLAPDINLLFLFSDLVANN